ncbi:hypothetical protein ACHAWF_018844 [Thalassiosira exigua]
MKFVHLASGVLLASGSGDAESIRATSSVRIPRARSYAASVAGLRALQQISHAQKGGRDLLLGGLLSETCGDTCTDDELCGSFVTAVDPASTCDAGCVPASALDMCDRLCSDGGAGAGGAVAVQRQQADGLFGSSSFSTVLGVTTDLACANCDFYRCCVGAGGYGACEATLPNVEDYVPEIEDLDASGDFDMQDLVDALVPDDWESMLSEGLEQLGDIFDADPEAAMGTNDNDLGMGSLQIFAWNATDWNWDALDWDGLGASMGQIAEGLHSLLDGAAAEFAAIVDDSTALSALDLECDPAACPVDGLCEAAGSGLNPANLDLASVDFDEVCASNALFLCAGDLEGACDERCEGDVGDGSASFCALCGVAKCCRAGGATASFEDCASEFVSQAAAGMATVMEPAMEDIGEALEGVATQLGEVMEGMATQLAGVIEVFVGDAATPDICPEAGGDDACPAVEGFCDVFSGESANFDLATIDYERACDDNAFVLCAPEGFEAACAEKCSGGAGTGAAALAVERSVVLELDPQDAFCAVCGIATCCQDKEESETFKDCASKYVPSWAVSEDSSGSTGVPAAEAPEPSVGDSEGPADAPAQDPASESAPTTSEGLADSSTEATPLEPAVGAGDVSASAPEPPVGPETPVVAAAVVERADLLDSGSSVSGPSVLLALASALVYVSL